MIATADAPRLSGVRLTVLPKIDGVIDEVGEWKGVPSIEGLCDQNTGVKVEPRARFWLAYDSEFVYFAAHLYDSEPKTIRAVEYRTNSGMPGDDSVQLSLDLSGSLSDFNNFTINPRGATSIELSGGRAAKREWSGEFLAAARITGDGWEAEARIPWQLMRIPAGGVRDVRFNMGRFMPRLSRYMVYTFTGNGRNSDTPIWAQVALPKPFVDHSLKMLPYIYTGHGEDEGVIANGGLDLKTQVTDSITAVGSVNPDFRNIENQILSLDFSRFARIADESRPFFQEGSQYMESGLYASQVIGTFDVGLNSYGKINDKTQFGLIDAIDFQHQNSFATSVTYAENANSNYRASLTSADEVGRDNQAFMFRYYGSKGPWGVFARSMASKDTETGSGGSHNVSLSYGHNGLNLWGEYVHCDANFNPALGFVPETDYKGFDYGMYCSRDFSHGSVQSQNVYAAATSFDRTDGNFYRNDYTANTWIKLRNRVSFGGGFDFSDFEGSNDHVFSASLNYPNDDPYRRWSAGIDTGMIDGEEYRVVSFGTNWRPIKTLQISLSHQSYMLGDSAEQAILGVNYDMGRDQSISGRAVRHDSDLNWYVAMRRSGNRGAEYYLILGDPNAARFTKSLILKMVVPFQLGPSGPSNPRHAVR